MSIIPVEARRSSDELLHAVGQLSLPELDRFVGQALALRAQRKAPALPQAEAELLLQINQGVSPDLQKRYEELIAKRQAEALTSDEYRELLHLTDEVEKIEARRMECLAELAHLRKTPLTALMKELGLGVPAYA